ncbi:roundabout homolog 2-like isoform X3 [Mya arenaria]|uniref:roundabout homolog 2-like isoform X3 n=1 Tax=Mya arenaria TaxID=6604 RepID=UPI0022E494C1|nr:roundabout homolog 2-like isoform X3 [Mya arenaria]
MRMRALALPWQLVLVTIGYTSFVVAADADYDYDDDDDIFKNAPNLRHTGFSPPSGNPTITEHPQDDFFARNEPATLNCKAEGNPKPTITWYRNGELVETTRDDLLSHRMLFDNGQLFFLRVIHNKNNQNDIGIYYCNATNIHGSAISDAANIQIAVLKDKFLAEPSDTTAAVGQSVTLHCNPPRGKPEPKVIWRKDGETVQTDKRVHIMDAGNLEIYSVEKTDSGEYLCVAVNKAGERHTEPGHLKVLDVPTFNKLPAPLTVKEGSVAEFYCDAVGDPKITIRWSKEKGTINYGRARVIGGSTLRIENVESSDEGVYVCTAENAAGSTKATAKLNVFAAPSFVVQPQDQIVARGRPVSLPCVTVGNPPPTIFWSKEGGGNLMFSNVDSGHHFVAEDGTLKISLVNDSDAGVYICEALNTGGAVTASAKITVIDGTHSLPPINVSPPPVITLGPQNQTLPVGGVAVMQCLSEGPPTPFIRWYKDSRPIGQSMVDPRIKTRSSGILEISDLKIQDSGKFTCKAVTASGETIWEAFLMVTSDQSAHFPMQSPTIAFLPEAPTKPLVSDVTDTTVHLSWTPGDQKTQFPITKFYVEYYGYGVTDGWMIASRDVVTESYTVERLQSNVTYTFLVRAVNEQGVGYPSPVSESVRTSAYQHVNRRPQLTEEEIKSVLNGNIVQLVNTTAINATSIKIIWTISKGDDLIEGYEIEYQHIRNIRTLQYGKSQKLRVPPTVTWYTVTGLTPYSWYELKVRAFYRNVLSWYSDPMKVQTARQYVLAAPDNVQVKKVSASSLSVSWAPPESHGIPVNSYQVLCRSKDGKENCSVITNGRTYHVVIDNLKLNKEYVVKVAAENYIGLGAWSEAYTYDGSSVFKSDGLGSTVKTVTEEETGEDDILKKQWFFPLVIGVCGLLLFLILLAFTICLFRRRKHRKKMKDQRFYTGGEKVPMHKGDDCTRNFYPPQYGVKDQPVNRVNDVELPPELRMLLPGQQGKKDVELEEGSMYKMAGGGASFPEMKTFYQADPVAPYATTALIQQQHLMKQRQGQRDHMFRPINQGYLPHSEGSADSCQKDPLSSDSGHDHSGHSGHSGLSGHSTTDHNHSDHLSPTSDSGSHSNEENNLLIKQRKKMNTHKEVNTPKQAMNWSDMLPPPPEHPPPSECSELPSYHEIKGENRSDTHSPMSPVSFSQLSACSCPNPHTQTPLSNWNMPVYSDTECPRCHSEKYYDPVTYCQEAFIRRTNSPRTQLMQPVNNRNNIPNNMHTCSPRATPCGNVHYQYSQPQRGPPSNCAIPVQGCGENCNSNNSSNKSVIKRASHSSHSDNEAPSIMPCFQAYRITPKEENEPRFIREEWGPDPAPPCHTCEHDSGMGLEEDGNCMDRACQSSLPSLAPVEYNRAPEMSSSVHASFQRGCESPASESADYATESDLEPSQEQNNGFTGATDQNTDCSSVHSSTGSSGDATFCTEEDFVSAVARAAEMSGLTVVGTTVCDPNQKSKKERRQRRPARPISPGYSTDSNYGSIDVIRKPYPKSQRKQQLLEQGKSKPVVQSVDYPDRPMFTSHIGVYDNPYARADYQTSYSNPTTPLSPARFSSLNRMSPLSGLNRFHDAGRGHYSAVSDRGGYSTFKHNIGALPVREDVV